MEQIYQLIVVFAAAVILHVVVQVVLRRLSRQALARAILPPALSLIWIIAFLFAAQIWLGPEATLVVKMRHLVVVLGVAWWLLRWKSLLIKGSDHPGVAAAGKVITIAVCVGALLLVLPIFGVDMKTVVTLGGFGSVAIGLAGKDVFSNLFSGMMLHITRPFVPGDWVSSPDKKLDGTVEVIGWYLTQIRNIDKQAVFVPNSIFSSVVMVNSNRLTHRKIETEIKLGSDALSRAPGLVKEIERSLRDNSSVDQAQHPIARITGYDGSSITILVRAFTKTVDYNQFLHIQEGVLAGIGQIIQSD